MSRVNLGWVKGEMKGTLEQARIYTNKAEQSVYRPRWVSLELGEKVILMFIVHISSKTVARISAQMQTAATATEYTSETKQSMKYKSIRTTKRSYLELYGIIGNYKGNNNYSLKKVTIIQS